MMNWLEEENARAKGNLEAEQVENPDAPRLMRPKRTQPKRQTRGIYVTDESWLAFQTIVMNHKLKGGKTQPQLAEEALEYIIQKYGSND
ncbi:hypothetical protein [Vibrio europaeus]|uniref:hypothetical protein n=1 Tax=Vibrio europaeus TaxID=300876 RepID=UPI00233EF37D|nr:hypothetical protein [Vibrio europaeus]MDC5711135.1 hypothetical protein [Vibrio europaeus]MDC5713164.1 hypothetical protein [Vibrio europaeus]